MEEKAREDERETVQRPHGRMGQRAGNHQPRGNVEKNDLHFGLELYFSDAHAAQSRASYKRLLREKFSHWRLLASIP